MVGPRAGSLRLPGGGRRRLRPAQRRRLARRGRSGRLRRRQALSHAHRRSARPRARGARRAAPARRQRARRAGPARPRHRWHWRRRSTASVPSSPTSASKLLGQTINPLARHPIDTPLDVGVRSINALLTVGRGQRIGLFAGSGVGKSVLLGMMARYTSADVIVVGLIGERGREVKEFVERILGPEGRRRSVVVASPGRQSAADPPARRLAGDVDRRVFPRARPVRAADHGFTDALRAGAARDRPRHRRGAGDQGLSAVGVRAPAARWWNAPATAPRARGSITAFYTVLTEGDDQQDPIADAARAILDGHVVLSRRIAEAGQYPAVDVEASVSRVMHEIIPPRTRRAGAPLPPDAVHLPAASRSHHHRRLPEGQRSAHRRGHRAVAGDAEIPDAAHRAARRVTPRR